MVKLRVINGGKSRDQSPGPGLKLFRVYTTVDNAYGYDGVRFAWIYSGRRKPAVTYAEVINDFDRVEKRVRAYFEEYVDELFTEEEARMLADFLQKTLKAEPSVVEEPLPLSSVFVPIPFRGIPASGGRGFHQLPEEAASGLPFKVCAYFDLRNCAPSVALQREPRERGVRFLQEALESLGLTAGVDRERIEAAVETLFDERGWFVQQGKTRSERVRERDELRNPDDTPVR